MGHDAHHQGKQRTGSFMSMRSPCLQAGSIYVARRHVPKPLVHSHPAASTHER